MIKPIANRRGYCLIVTAIVILLDSQSVPAVEADEVSEDLSNIVALVEENMTLPMDRGADASESSSEETAFAEDEVRCLALNIYFEARGESEQGQRAVAHVVMNRVADKHYPATVCGVVRQGGEKRRHRCQFSWWCDGRSDKPKIGQAWNRSLQLANAIYAGKSLDPTDGALWYHAVYVKPYWRDALTFGRKIGRHHFYLKKPPQLCSRN